MSDSYDEQRWAQARSIPDQQHRLESGDSSTRMQRRGLRIVFALGLALVVAFIVLLAVNPGGSSDDDLGAALALVG